VDEIFRILSDSCQINYKLSCYESIFPYIKPMYIKPTNDLIKMLANQGYMHGDV